MSEIELLGEYCTQLTADVVTGKLDVRDAAADLPDEDLLDGHGDLEDTFVPEGDDADDESDAFFRRIRDA